MINSFFSPISPIRSRRPPCSLFPPPPSLLSSSRIGKKFWILSIIIFSSDDGDEKLVVEEEDDDDADDEVYNDADNDLMCCCCCCCRGGGSNLILAINSRFNVLPTPAISECIAMCLPNGFVSAVLSNSGEPGSIGGSPPLSHRCRLRRPRKIPDVDDVGGRNDNSRCCLIFVFAINGGGVVNIQRGKWSVLVRVKVLLAMEKRSGVLQLYGFTLGSDGGDDDDDDDDDNANDGDDDGGGGDVPHSCCCC
jgi:hypothetical protein